MLIHYVILLPTRVTDVPPPHIRRCSGPGLRDKVKVRGDTRVRCRGRRDSTVSPLCRTRTRETRRRTTYVGTVLLRWTKTVIIV